MYYIRIWLIIEKNNENFYLMYNWFKYYENYFFFLKLTWYIMQTTLSIFQFPKQAKLPYVD